jgi:hypothetical protein
MKPRPIWEEDRVPWEYADGPSAGTDVPIAGEPREEEAPGVPAEQPESEGDANEPTRGASANLEEREVAIHDLDLAREINDRLTEEVRDVIGKNRVRVPRDRPRPSHGERPPRRGLLAYLSRYRLLLTMTFAAAVVVGAIISLVTGSWWFIALPLGLHAVGTIAVTVLLVRMTTITERPSPTTMAVLEEAGIRNPEEYFSHLVAEFTEPRRRRSADTKPRKGLADVVTPGENERTVEAGADPAGAAAEQSSAVTPSSGPSRPVGPRPRDRS